MRASGIPLQNHESNGTGEMKDINAKSVAAIYMIREAVRDLYRFLARYPRLTRLEREDHFLFAIRRIQLLKAELIPISPEAFMESVQLSVNMLSFRECLDQKYAELAKNNLSRICDLLCLNDQSKDKQ